MCDCNQKSGTQSVLILFFCAKITNIQKNTVFRGEEWEVPSFRPLIPLERILR